MIAAPVHRNKFLGTARHFRGYAEDPDAPAIPAARDLTKGIAWGSVAALAAGCKSLYLTK
jgi:hypothetical protein